MADRLSKGPTYWLLALALLAGYLAMRLWFPLAPLAARMALADVSTFATWPRGVVAYALLLCLLFALYWLAYRHVTAAAQPPRLLAILVPAALFGLVLLGTYPINATDIFRYLIQGRVSAIHGQNPYLVPPSQLSVEPFLPLAGEWARATTPYGPVWELLASQIARLGGDNLSLGLLLFKGLAVAVHLLVALLIWLLLARSSPADRAGRTLLWAWNPALLLIFSTDGHNDGLVLMWLLLGLLVMRRGWHATGLVVMALAPLTKMSGLLPIPFFLVATWAALPDLRSRLWLAVRAALGMAVVGWLLFLPFGSPVELGVRLLAEGSKGGGFSPLTLLVLATRRLGGHISLPAAAGVAGLLFTIAALWLLWRTWKGRSPVRGAADVSALYLLQALNFRIWYASWVLPWLLLDSPQAGPVGSASYDRDAEFRLRAGLWLLLTTQLSVLLYGRIRVALLGRDQLWAHLIGIPFTFILPLVLAALTTRAKPPDDET